MNWKIKVSGLNRIPIARTIASVPNLFDAGSDEHDVYAAYTQLIDDQEPVNDQSANTTTRRQVVRTKDIFPFNARLLTTPFFLHKRSFTRLSTRTRVLTARQGCNNDNTKA